MYEGLGDPNDGALYNGFCDPSVWLSDMTGLKSCVVPYSEAGDSYISLDCKGLCEACAALYDCLCGLCDGDFVDVDGLESCGSELYDDVGDSYKCPECK